MSLLASLNDPASDEVWTEFAAIYRPLVFRVARAKGLQDADADDLAQEVLTVVRRAISSFDVNAGGSFRGWLFQITRNLVVNHLTRGRGPIGSGDSDVQQMLHQQPADGNEASALFRLEYRRSRFQQAARKLKSEISEDIWQAFWLTAVDGQSIENVAQQLKKSPGAIRMARCRVLARMRLEVAKAEE